MNAEYWEDKVDVWIENNIKEKRGALNAEQINKQPDKSNMGNNGNVNSLVYDKHSKD